MEPKFAVYSKQYGIQFLDQYSLREFSFGVSKEHYIDESCSYYPINDKDVFLMQYVGIKDLDNKEIYEGFILEFNHGANQTIAVVVYDAPAFCLRIINSPMYRKDVIVQWDLSWFKDPRIIGNIYEGYTK